ncbi:MAG: hypothetical protein H6839_15120 [Planctomycetes bacterium]|nr:hypothetical protein [Planctomycetota bacterium]
MRWVFTDPNDREENAAREAVRGRIDAWWQEFAANSKRISGVFSRREEFDLVAFMQRTLQAVDENLMWEFGPALHGEGHRLAISPEAEHGLHPLTDEVLARAPRIPGFEFYHGRPPEGPAGAVMSVDGRVGVDISNGSVRVDVGEMNRVDVSYFFPRVDNEKNANHAAFIASESMFGEQCLDRWVGAIEAWPRPEGEGWMPMEQSSAAMQRAIDAVLESLPDGPWASWINDCDWTGLELNPPEDYEPSAHRFGDLLYATVPHTEMMQGILRGTLFHSGRYSRLGEKFCYLKLDESELPKDKRFDFRRPAEDAIDAGLRASDLGCLVGGGSGVWFGYCLLALADVAGAIPVIREVMRTHNASVNSWLLFLDYDWCDEWVGIYDDTPPPP